MIRLGKKEDLDEIMKIVKVAVRQMNDSGNDQWDEAYPTRKTFETDIVQKNLFLIEAEGCIKAFIVLNQDESPEYQTINWDHTHSLVIHRMIVSPSEQGQKLGTRLMEYSEKLAKKRKLGSIKVDTFSKNKPMLKLIEKFDYVYKGIVHFRNKPEAFKCFEKVLKE